MCKCKRVSGKAVVLGDAKIKNLPNVAERQMDLKEKIETNTWDSIDDFIRVMNEARAGNWHWFKNTKCKYVELRVDMRDGGCIIKNRAGERIDPKELAFQYGEDKPHNSIFA